jgi:hypothetical protein
MSFTKKSNQGGENGSATSFAPKDKMRKNGTIPGRQYQAANITKHHNSDTKKGVQKRHSLITLDYLELLLSIGNLSRECFNQKGIAVFYHGNECYKLELLPFGGKKWRSAANVYYGDELLGTLHFDSIFETLADKAKFKLENSTFYGQWADITQGSITSNFAKSFGSEVLSVLRADVALDGCKYGDFAHKVYYHEVVPLRPSSLKGGHWSTDKQNWQRINTGFGYGSRQGGRFFRCYDKSLEISEKSTHKVYILDYWQNNNLDQAGGHVWRLEAELRSDFLKTVDGFTWEHLFDKKRLLSLFQVATKNYFEFVDEIHIRGTKNAEQLKKRLQRAEKIQVIDFSEVHTETYQRVTAEKKPKTDRTAKIMIKQLALSAALTAETEPEKALNYAKAAGLLMEENSLEDYVMKKTHFWAPQIEREAWRRGKGVNSMLDLVNLATSLQNLQNLHV